MSRMKGKPMADLHSCRTTPCRLCGSEACKRCKGPVHPVSGMTFTPMYCDWCEEEIQQTFVDLLKLQRRD